MKRFSNFQQAPSSFKYASMTAGALGALILGGYAFGGGCGSDTNLEDGYFGSGTRQTSMALSAQVGTDSEVTGMSFGIERVACDEGETVEPFRYDHSGRLEDLTFPADLVPDQPYHDDSEHMFADHYVVLPAGCYTVKATPMFEGQPSSVCSEATATGVRVQDGRTTEVTLISQCEGAERGGLDTAATLNRPPTIEAVVYEPSKFVALCQASEICVTASDPDNDPLEFEFSRTGGPMVDQPVMVGQTRATAAGTERCVMVEPGAVGAYGYKVTVYDLLNDPDEGPMRFETYFQQLGEARQSRDTLEFPLYVQDSDRYECSESNNDGGGDGDGGTSTSTSGDGGITTTTTPGGGGNDTTTTPGGGDHGGGGEDGNETTTTRWRWQ